MQGDGALSDPDAMDTPLTGDLQRLARTHDDLAAALGDLADTALSRRPSAGSWSPKEIVCHLRDIEELFMIRFRSMLAMDEPKFLVLGEMPAKPDEWGIVAGDPLPLDPDRWVEERQYLRNDTGAAMAAFHRRRTETLAFLARLTPERWQRGSIHATRGRMTFAGWVALIAAHDENHLGQLRRALDAGSGS